MDRVESRAKTLLEVVSILMVGLFIASRMVSESGTGKRRLNEMKILLSPMSGGIQAGGMSR